ncbi:hypothetical protein GCM10027275_53460 [Rhabdobacter roseus]|uniref:YD repeat-containing protein n=1 Tax=Rhabdobacter roseus TaxID=1655419 RepID=A0A840TY97_9BACT|nr:hypothetical protein [Rhabdobacter roseus]MBB5286263.1 YD repeat-containing protein [Rhabdobacter roseus]
MKKSLVFLSLLLAILVLDCKRKKEDGPNPQVEGCLMMLETIDGRLYRRYEYNEDKSLFRIQQYQTGGEGKLEKRYTFEYDANGFVKLFRETNLLPPYQNFQYEIFNSTQDRAEGIVQSLIQNSGPRFVQSYALQYDDRGNVVQYDWADSYWRYEYDDRGNVTRWYIKAGSTPEQLTAEYANYDDKRNLYYYSEGPRLINLIIGGGTSAQNPGSFKFFGTGGIVAQTGIVTYQYNEKDMPVQASVSIFGPSGVPATQAYRFEYECL